MGARARTNLNPAAIAKIVTGKDEAERISAIQELVEGNAFNPDSKRAQNVAVMKEANRTSKPYVRFREAMKRKWGLDIEDRKKFPVHKPNFDWNKLHDKLQEADSETGFTQFLRAGVQTVAMDAFETVETSFEDWVTVVNSNRSEELYAPNHGIAFPREVGERMRYPEVGAAALDIKLKNRKYGSMYPVTWELLEDDQTGTFQRQSAQLGEYLKLVTEVLVMGKLASLASLTYQDMSIPTSETQPSYESNYPWTLSSAPFRGGGFNKATPVAMTLASIQAGIKALMNQWNLQGIKMQVKPNRLVIGPQLAFDAAVLSSYYPSGAQAAGVTGGAFAINPIGPEGSFKTIANMTVSRYMVKSDGTWNGDSTAWYLVDDKKPGFIVQYREPVTVVQEAPNAGQSFELDVVRFKARTRQNADFIDPRYLYQGNDGSV
jgi:hypothetical protein